MKKKQLLWIGGLFLIVATSLISLGMIFSKSEDEKLNGLSGEYDVSPNGMIAYVTYDEGKPELHLYDVNESLDTRVLELENDKGIVDPTFSNDDATLAFITRNKDLEMELSSTIHFLELDTKESKELFMKQSVITEIEFSLEDDSLVYLNADTFENYSPIASKRPHDFDIYEYKIEHDEHVQITQHKKYGMDSLTIGNARSFFVQMMDDADGGTREEVFQTKQRIFKGSLDNPTHLDVVSDPDREVDIYDFTLFPNGKEIIFQSISNIDAGGTFQYELYVYDLETKEEEQLTTLKGYATNPVVSASMDKVYFMVDKQFAKRDADYHLYQMNKDGSEVEEIQLLGE